VAGVVARHVDVVQTKTTTNTNNNNNKVKNKNKQKNTYNNKHKNKNKIKITYLKVGLKFRLIGVETRVQSFDGNDRKKLGRLHRSGVAR